MQGDAKLGPTHPDPRRGLIKFSGFHLYLHYGPRVVDAAHKQAHPNKDFVFLDELGKTAHLKDTNG